MGTQEQERGSASELTQLLVSGQPITWDKAISTGGKWPLPAVFIEKRGASSALIESGGKRRIVRLASIRAD